jgi:hypothetical protein
MYSGGETRCALGAALTAIGECTPCHNQGVDAGPYIKITDIWPWTHNHVVNPTDNSRIPAAIDIRTMIWMLNDSAKWTRPQIAAWVAEQEVKLGVVEQVEAEIKDGEHATA